MADFMTAVEDTLKKEGGFYDNLQTGEIVSGGWTNFTLAKIGMLPSSVTDIYAKQLKEDDPQRAEGEFRMFPSRRVVDRAARDTILAPVINFVKSLTKDQKISLYLRYFWNPARLSQVNDQALANKVFDVSVNQGSDWGIIELQNACNDLATTEADWLVTDGVVGPKTIAAVNALDPVKLLAAFRARAKARYEAIGGPNLPGWLARLAS